MDTITGNIIISTDWHFGIKNNSVSRLSVCVNMIKEHLDAINKNNIRAVFMGGDVFHERSAVNVNTINVAIKCIQAIAKKCKVYLICGNHDCFLKNSTDINSLNIFSDNSNIKIISKAEDICINGKTCLLVPWLADLSVYKQESYDMMIGHFEVSSKYLIQSYIEDQRSKKNVSDEYSKTINSDELLTGIPERKSGQLIGNFINLVKRGGTIWAGHIHKHSEFMTKGRRFVFIGSPYQQTMGDENNECGFYVINEKWKDTFIETKTTPKHIRIIMSEALTDGFDFKRITGNIIQKIYDIDIPLADEARLSQKISDFKPFEEILPDYIVAMQENRSDESKSLELIRKSKLDYIKNYVDNIDQSTLTAQEVNRAELYETLEKYYNTITYGN